MSQRSVGHDHLVGGTVEDDCLEGCVLLVGMIGEVCGGEELPGPEQTVCRFFETDQVGQIGVLLDVVAEVRGLPIDEELLEDDVPHRHRERGVGAGLGRQPFVRELHIVGVVRSDCDDLLAAVAGLGHPVSIRGPGHREVGAPHDEVTGIPPVPRFGHISLVTEDLRGSNGQIGIPVVEAQHRAADQVDEPRTGGMRDHRHRRDRGKAGDPVGSPLLDRVNVGGGDDLGSLVPRSPDQTALAASGLVGLGASRVVDDVGPRLDRIAAVLTLRLAEHLQQDASDIRIAHPCRRIGVPGERCTSRTTARFVLRRIRADRRIVGLLRLPGDDPVLDIHLP